MFCRWFSFRDEIWNKGEEIHSETLVHRIPLASRDSRLTKVGFRPLNEGFDRGFVKTITSRQCWSTLYRVAYTRGAWRAVQSLSADWASIRCGHQSCFYFPVTIRDCIFGFCCPVLYQPAHSPHRSRNWYYDRKSYLSSWGHVIAHQRRC